MNGINTINSRWFPGQPLYSRERSSTGYMVSVKEDRCYDHVNPDAARWCPVLGWRPASVRADPAGSPV